jgi:hypothetical protein
VAGGREVARLVVPASSSPYVVASAEVELQEGIPLELAARTPLTIQSTGVFSDAPALPAGWRIAAETPDAIVLGRT